MLGSSRTSLRLVYEALDASIGDPGLAAAGSDLLAVADLLTRETALRRSLADAGRSPAERRAILNRLIGDKISPLALSLAGEAVGHRWSSDADLVDGIEALGASALVAQAEKEGRADRVADELFRFGRIVEADGELQLTLTSIAMEPAAKKAIVSELLSDKADPATIELAGFVVTHLRGRRVDEAFQMLVELAAKRRGELSAVVRVAAPLEPDQLQRLSTALQAIYKQPLQLSVQIDPSVIGGVSVQVGDEVIDGTIAHRIEQARRRLAG